MRRLRCGLLLVLLGVVLAGCGSKAPRKLHEKEGGFSYDPPAGWQVKEMPGQKYRIAFGPTENGLAPNINVMTDTASMDLDEYLDKGLETMKRTGTISSEPSRQRFATEDGEKGYYWTFDYTMLNHALRARQYFFEKGDRKYVFTCTTSADTGAALDPVFEASAKSFRLD